jgi:hypothetical protein
VLLWLVPPWTVDGGLFQDPEMISKIDTLNSDIWSLEYTPVRCLSSSICMSSISTRSLMYMWMACGECLIFFFWAKQTDSLFFLSDPSLHWKRYCVSLRLNNLCWSRIGVYRGIPLTVTFAVSILLDLPWHSSPLYTSSINGQSTLFQSIYTASPVNLCKLLKVTCILERKISRPEMIIPLIVCCNQVRE